MSTFWIVFLIFVALGPVRYWGGGRGRWGSRAFARGWRRGGGWADDGRSEVDAARLTEALEQRTQDLELLQTRVTELENRLDFAERLLAERRNVEIESTT